MKKSFAVMALASLGLSACSSSSAADACGHVFDVLVASSNRCPIGVDNPVYPSGKADFVAGCVAEAAVKHSGFTVDYLEHCADQLDSATCYTPASFNCGVPLGQIKTGGGCSFDEQCAGGVCTGSDNSGTTCGTCGNLSAAGASCDMVSCAPGLTCLLTTGGQRTCVKEMGLAEGSACSTDSDPGDDCVAGTVCVAGTGANAKTCQKLPTVGQPCNSSGLCGEYLDCSSGNICVALVKAGGDCSTNACEPSLECDTTTQKCIAYPVAKKGGSCATPATDGVCAAGLYCANASQTCVADLPLGAACDNTNGDTCVPPASCTNNVCTKPADGSQCK